MRRTNVYLDETQLDLLRQLGTRRGRPVAGLVREAVDEWLQRNGVRALDEDEWQHRFDALLGRRAAVAARGGPDVEHDVAEAVAEVRAEVRAERARGR